MTPRARQRDQAAALVAGHGRIVAEFFGTGGHRPSGRLSTGGHFVWVEVQCYATGQDRDGD